MSMNANKENSVNDVLQEGFKKPILITSWKIDV